MVTLNSTEETEDRTKRAVSATTKQYDCSLQKCNELLCPPVSPSIPTLRRLTKPALLHSDAPLPIMVLKIVTGEHHAGDNFGLELL